MRIVVLGSGAGGGLPQWNCNCEHCDATRRGAGGPSPRSQSSIAVSADDERWIVINASPDIRTQLTNTPALHPVTGCLRGSPIQAVMLVDAQIDHTAGLLSLREGDPLPLYTAASVHEDLTSAFPVIPLLERYCGVDWHEIPVDGQEFTVQDVADLRFTALPLWGKAPPYTSHRDAPRRGDNIGLVIRDRRAERTAFYAPGLAAIEPDLERRLAEVDCLLVDGTFWSDDEMMRRGIGNKRAADMGHLPLSGDGGMISALARLPHPVKYLIHINNTNPVLNVHSPEYAALGAAGILLTRDGMTIEV